MALTCNIDSRGRRFRIAVGLICLLVAAALFIAAGLASNPAALIPAVAFTLAGVICLWQGWKGYCIARGLGFRTPI